MGRPSTRATMRCTPVGDWVADEEAEPAALARRRRPRPASPGRVLLAARVDPAARPPGRSAGQAASTSPRAKVRDGADELAARRPPARGSKSGGSSSISARDGAAARRAARRVTPRPPRRSAGRRSAPRPSASSGSSGMMPPIWFSPGMSAAVSTAATPGSAPGRVEVDAEQAAVGTGEASTAACSRPAAGSRSSMKSGSPACRRDAWRVASPQVPPARAPSEQRMEVGRTAGGAAAALVGGRARARR